jgi:predicted amidohydrolase YtcJ
MKFPTKTLAPLAAVLISSGVIFSAHAQSCSKTILYNGKIATVNQHDTMALSVTIEGDRIIAVGVTPGIPRHEGCARLVDLKGRRAIPGLIDSHNHIVVASSRPGHDARIDVAASIAEMQQLIHNKAATLTPEDWVTAIGGWSPDQFAERRMPTQADLDAAAPNSPVYIQIGFDGPAATNSKGRAFFEKKGIKVGSDGSIEANAPTIAAYSALESTWTFADKKRGALNVMAYAASVGLTMSDDKGGPWPVDTPGAQGLAETANRTNNVNPFTGYDHFLALGREDKMSMRLRIFFYMQDSHSDLTFLKARLNNQFTDFGNGWIKVAGVGERIHSGPFPFTPNTPSETYEAAARLTAQKGWSYDEHAMGIGDEKEFTAIWEKINKETPLASLHWCLAHVPGIDMETLHRLQAMGVGVSAAGSRYTASRPPRNSPKDISPFRLLVESGIHVGYGSDGGTVAPLNPWAHMYYMVTGKNNAGQLVAEGQTLTRAQALRMYTASQPWFTKEDDSLGSIEVGKLADVVVLSDDFLDSKSVPDEAIKHITSVLTIVGGRVVHDSHVLKVPASLPTNVSSSDVGQKDSRTSGSSL